ncbi:MAG: LEA type 2 family protein [Longimicrobiales bacterium]
MRAIRHPVRLAVITLGLAGCATLGQLIQPPTFSAATTQQSQLRLLGPGAGHPLGGLGVRLYARVQNPNPFGLTLTRLAGNLFIENQRTANVDLPLGLPLRATQDTVLPIDISVSFADIPNIVNTLKNALTRNTVAYRLDGTFGVDAGALGQPSFGPQTLFGGDVRVVR